MEIHRYELQGNVSRRYRVALLADVHDRYSELIPMSLSAWRPDLITMAGDITDNKTEDKARLKQFLDRCTALAPCFYSLGNHEYNFSASDAQLVRESGVHLLLDEYVRLGELLIGGLRSRTKYRPFPRGRSSIAPCCGWLDEFEKQSGYKILLSHHPEYYEPWLKARKIDLVLSGHAHGGQMRFLGKGLIAPGQGLLPRYTKGLYDERFIVSAGLCNSVSFLPRLGNPTELVLIDLVPTTQTV